MKIREFRRGDEKVVAKLICTTFKKFNNKEGSKKGVKGYLNWHSTRKSKEELFKQYNKELSLVAVDKGKIMGFIKGNKGQIGNLFVLGKYHGKGIGKELLLRFESLAKKKNSKQIKVRTSLYAIPFYSCQRYKKTTGIRNFFGIKVQPMVKKL